VEIFFPHHTGETFLYEVKPSESKSAGQVSWKKKVKRGGKENAWYCSLTREPTGKRGQELANQEKRLVLDGER